MSADRGGRRLCKDRREFSFTAHIPERRTGRDRRSGLDRRILDRSSPRMTSFDRRKSMRNLQFFDESVLQIMSAKAKGLWDLKKIKNN